MLSGSLASPTPPAGGQREERGDEENETESRATFKAQVALAAVTGDKTLAELAEHLRVHPTQITEWKQPLLARAGDVFGSPTSTSDAPDLKVLHAKIGQLALEHDC